MSVFIAPRAAFFHSAILRLSSIAVACTALAACSVFDKASGGIAGVVTPYRVEVVQGNFVSKEQKEALQTGMPRNQVRDILGSPLVASVFHGERWEYVFTIRRQGQEPQQRKLTVFFKGDVLDKVESDALISEEEFNGSLSGNRKLGKVPVLEASADKLPAAAGAAAAKAPNIATPTATPSASEAARVYPPLEPATRP